MAYLEDDAGMNESDVLHRLLHQEHERSGLIRAAREHAAVVDLDSSSRRK